MFAAFWISLAGFYEGSIVIAEDVGSSPTGNMHDGYELYGLTSLPREYKDVTLIDISIGRTVVVQRKKVFLNSLKDTEWKDFQFPDQQDIVERNLDTMS